MTAQWGTTPTTAEDTPVDALSCLEAMRQERAARLASEARELALAAHFADLYSWTDDSTPSLPGRERPVRLGSDGTPEVAEHCVLELAAALHMPPSEGQCLISNALDLRHRMPCLWSRVMSGGLPVWQARRIATWTQELDQQQAGLVDRELHAQIDGMGFSRIRRLVEGLVLDRLDPELSDRRRAAARDARGVWVDAAGEGTTALTAVLDAPDAIVLDAQVDRLARILADGGSQEPEAARRARALGILGRPAQALQLIQASLLDQLPPTEDFEQICDRRGQAGHACGTVTVDPDALLPRAHVAVHLTDLTLANGEGLMRSRDLGATLAEWAHDLFGHHRVTIRPVIDQNHQVASDAYECPPTMREAVELRNEFEAFPWSHRTSGGLDLDHTVPWLGPSGDADESPPERWRRIGGPTHPDNLAPLSRSTHRAKTHSGWRVQQPLPGVLLWQSPLGFRYLVTPSRTLELGRPDAPQCADPVFGPTSVWTEAA
ncbi:DUF222 domain-containing protein [Luteococcus sp. Sow4_B9]|uniref:HNH endonuclease signature motif containing protein n=1 Tax=Luteococcus sp. Sow4_B9 TaxID=3438792 RepID=UPI003F98FC39